MLLSLFVSVRYAHRQLTWLAQMIRKGDIVTFKPEWQDDGDEGFTFLACDDEDGARFMVGMQLGFSINPSQVVTVDMIATVNGVAL